MDQYIDLTDETPHSNIVEHGYPLKSTSVEEIDPTDWEASLQQKAVLEDSARDCAILSDINPSVSEENDIFFINYHNPFESISLAIGPHSSVVSRPTQMTLIYK